MSARATLVVAAALVAAGYVAAVAFLERRTRPRTGWPAYAQPEAMWPR